MATKKKLLQAAAGSAGGGGLDITDVFSTYLYTGTGAARSFNNGIDLAGEGGLVWIKTRSATAGHSLQDTERGAGNMLSSNGTWASSSRPDTLTSFNSNGFSLGADTVGYVNYSSSYTYASWTFRKAPKFFDVIQYVGNNTARTISHNLGCDVGMIMIKCTETTDDWVVYHRKLDATNPEDYRITLNGNFPRESGLQRWNSTAPTSTEFSLGTEDQVNDTGKTFIAYVFAHNDSGDGEFGPDSDQDIIKCGSYTGTGSDGNFVDLGFEPQWMIVKNTTAGSSDQWWMFDSIRGMAVQPTESTVLFANLNNAELSGSSVGDNLIEPLATGFNAGASSSATNGSGNTYIYMAIRRGPLAPPEDATEVFDVKTRINADPSYVSSTGVVDMAIDRYFNTNDDSRILSRLTDKRNLDLNNNTIESTGGYTYYPFDYNTGWFYSAGAAETNRISFMWKRAPGFFDVVCWDAENTANRRLKHNLGVIPEMVWIKNREMMGAYTEDWMVYHKYLGSNGILELNNYDDSYVTSAMWPSPSATEFGIRENASFSSGTAMIGYFFATLDGISKVGSFTGNGSSQTIDCGFTSGARFILIKRTNANGNWVVFNSLRGIITGISPSLFLNDRQAERTYEDVIDPASSGFIVNQETQQNLNVQGGNYIFYAIA